jgi:glycerol-3-phosphate dehydrogenase
LKLVRIKSIELELKMPIVDSLYRIIFENEPLNGSVEKLLGKDELKDVEFSTNLKS